MLDCVPPTDSTRSPTRCSPAAGSVRIAKRVRSPNPQNSLAVVSMAAEVSTVDAVAIPTHYIGSHRYVYSDCPCGREAVVTSATGSRASVVRVRTWRVGAARARWEERRVGKECVSTGRSRGSRGPYKKKTPKSEYKLK